MAMNQYIPANQIEVKWPKTLSFSMAPFGYIVLVDRVADPDLPSVEYKCRKCGYTIGIDSENGQPSAIQKTFREHVDAAH